MNKAYLLLLTLMISSLTIISCGDDEGGDSQDLPCQEDPEAACTVFERSSLAFVDENDVEHTVNIVTITDRGEGTGSITFHNDTTYILDGLVFVNDGQTLIIEPGTVIKGRPGSGEEASALIVARGAMINAQGTASNPIILTAEADQTFSAEAGIVRNGVLNAAAGVGLWGGLIILGNAELNSSPGESAIEGISTNEERGLYGGDDNDDNSGTLRYISVRHGGTDIGAGNEINGVTFGGVGSGTTVEYIEVFANKDDGFEWFGGTVNTKYLVSAYNQDDAMDYDEGWRGNNQFWLVFQVLNADRGGEHDGGTDPETGTPYAVPTIFNASYFGIGENEGKSLITFRDNAGGHYANSIFSRYSNGVDIEWLGGPDVEDSYNRFVAGELTFRSNIMHQIAGNFFVANRNDGSDLPLDPSIQDRLSTYFANEGNTTSTDPMFDGDLVTPMNPIAVSGLATSTNPFFTTARYKGAVDPATGPTWIAGWTRLSQEF